VIRLESEVVKDVTLRVERPFLLLIREAESGTILFLGRVLDSEGGALSDFPSMKEG
jgi:serine protease inhibitor